jgi:integrase
MSDKRNLTKRTIEALPIPSEGRVEYRDTEDRYLRMVVSAEGRHTWRYVRKVLGRTRFYTIGTYPEMTPDEARRESKVVGAEYDAGRDPAVEKKRLRDLLTWADLFKWYMESHAIPHKRTWKYDKDMNRLYCSKWQVKPYSAITVDFVTQWHKKIGRAIGKHKADRVLAMVKTVFSKALEAEVIEGKNPAATVRKFYTDPRQYARDRFLSGDELSRLLKTLGEYHDQDMSDFVMVALFTGARRGNVQAMRWQDMDRSDLDKPTWNIPGEVSKNGEPMKVMLVEPVLSILNRRYEGHAKTDRTDKTPSPRGEYVFPSKRGNSKTPHLVEPKKAWASICKSAGLENVRIHDLRRTLGSWQANLGASLQIIGASLGHKSMKSTEVYARLTDDPVRASVGGAAVAMLQAANGKEVTK